MRVVALITFLFVTLFITVGCSALSTRQGCVEFLGEIDRDYNPVVPVLFEWNGEWYAAMCGQKQGDTSMLFLLQNIYVQKDKQEFIIATPGKFFPRNFTVIPTGSETLHLFFSGGLAEEDNELKKEPREKKEPIPDDFWEKHYELKSALLFCELSPHNKGENGNTCKVVWEDSPAPTRYIPGGWVKAYKGPSEYIVYCVDEPITVPADRSACIRWYSSVTQQVQQIEAKHCWKVWIHGGDSAPVITMILHPRGSQIRRMSLGVRDVNESELLYQANQLASLDYADEEYVAFAEDIYLCLLDVKRKIITKVTRMEFCSNIRVLRHGRDRYFVFHVRYGDEGDGIRIRKICPGGISVQEQFIPFGVRDARVDLGNCAIIGRDFVFLFDKDRPERDTRQFYCRSVALKE